METIIRNNIFANTKPIAKSNRFDLISISY